MSNIIVLRNVYAKTPGTCTLQPCKDPKTGMLPPHVKRVNGLGDMVLSEKELASDQIFIPENMEIAIMDGSTFNLDDKLQKAQWEAIKNSAMIAPERTTLDKSGNYMIDGSVTRYGFADYYIERVEEIATQKINKAKLRHDAEAHVFEASEPKRVQICKLLGVDKAYSAPAKIQEYLLDQCKVNPQRILDIFTGSDTELRLLLIDALNKKVIVVKNKIYIYADNIALGVKEEAVLSWFKQAGNASLVEDIKKETYPEMYATKK